MPINLMTETIVTFAKAAKHVPPRRGDRPVNKTTIGRWHTHGKHGVYLEATRLPGGLVTSLEALQRFTDRLTDVATGKRPSPAMSELSKREVLPQVESELDKLGI